MSIKKKNPRRNKLYNDGEIFEKENASIIDLVEENYLILKENINNFSFKEKS